MGAKLSISDLLLISLEKAGEGYLKIEDFLQKPHLYRYGYPREIKKPTLMKTIKRLRKRGYIEYSDRSELILKLTEFGNNKALISKIKTFNERDWDGSWRLVSFDIPETNRAVRDILRYKLKELGFTKLQNSVWISKVDCAGLIEKYIHDLGIGKWVKVIESDKLV